MQKLKQSLFAKTLAVLLYLVCLSASVLGVFFGLYLVEQGYYQKNLTELLDWKYDAITQENMSDTYYAYVVPAVTAKDAETTAAVQQSLEGKFALGVSNFRYRVLDYGGNTLFSNTSESCAFVSESAFSIYTSAANPDVTYDPAITTITVQGYIESPFTAQDQYTAAREQVTVTYNLRYAVWVVTAFFLLCSMALFLFLLSAAGHKKGQKNPSAGTLEKLPADLFLLLLLAVWSIEMAVLFELYVDAVRLLAMVAFLVLDVLLLLCFCMSMAVRCKVGIFWRTLLLYRCISAIGRGLRWLGGSLLYLLRRFPLTWKAMAVFAAITLAEFVVMILCWYQTESLSLWWAIEKMVLAVLFCVTVLNLKDLQTGAKHLAAGDLEHKIGTEKMFWEFKAHALHLNSIGEGMSKAVEERLKSERFKTELITNVSHDIKTPLTSIISYVDLLKKEELPTPQSKEYVQVLERQSARLKKLIEDLTEASKASSGSLHIQPSLTDAGVLLAQTAGEYASRLQKANLELLVHGTQENQAFLWVDGRLMARIFDNLMSNICKYALGGTRVYIDLVQQPDATQIVFRNISGYPLNITSEELMERFVRGDRSRHTEGSGLGLSIARSLTELQGGRFDLYVDGDLFKVILTFKAMQQQ